MIYHTLPRPDGNSLAEQAVSRIVDAGFTAVGFFFVLSGFILTTVYRDEQTVLRAIQFWAARVARIYPTYVVSLLLDLPRLLLWRIGKYALAKGALLTAGTLIAQIFLLQVWVPKTGGLNFPSWSIATEAFFYLCFPLILAPSLRVRGLNVNLLLCSACIVGALAIAGASAVLVHDTDLALVIGRNPIVRLPEFAAGMFLANVFNEFGRRDDAEWPTRIFVVGVLVSLAVALMAHGVPDAILDTALLPSYSAIILGGAMCRGRLAALLSLPTMVLLGEASYALYLIHAPAWSFVQLWSPSPTVAIFLLYIAGTVVCSILMFVFFERPMRTHLNAFFGERLGNGRKVIVVHGKAR